MLKSMTGFGRGEAETEQYIAKVQVKSVNHRYADITVKLPRLYTFLEDKIRRGAASVISRGKVEIIASVDCIDGGDKQIKLNYALAEEYVGALRGLSKLGINDDLSMSSMMRLTDIFDVEYKEVDESEIEALVLSALDKALNDFDNMRTEEGARLEQNLNAHLSEVLNLVDKIEERSPLCVEEYRDKLKRKLDEVLGDKIVDETRIITEAAIFADKISVDEETVRLKSHVCAFKDNMAKSEPIGKKLDFIVQEMNREANTTGSKCNDALTASYVVELKSVIEKIREQIQNIE